MSVGTTHNSTAGEPQLPSVPCGWCWTTIETLADVGTGTTPSRTNSAYWTGGSIPWVTSTAVNASTVHDGNEFVTETAIAETTLRLFPKNTLLLALYGEGKTRGKVSELMIEATINQALAAIVIRAGVVDCRRYLKAFLDSNYLQMRRQAVGGMQPNLNLSIVKRISVPLAPLNEQRRIVAKIEELFSDLDAGVAALERARGNLKRYRASVLKAAVEGALTAAWREQHPHVEPASELLHRLLAERRQKWEADQLAKFAAAQKSPPKNWQDKYQDPAPPDTTALPKLPESWCWASADQLCGLITDGEHNQPRYQERGMPMLTATHVRDGTVTFSNAKMIAEADYERARKRCGPIEGDILVVCVGATTGRAGIVGSMFEFALVRSVLLLKPSTTGFGAFLLKWIQSPWCQQWITRASGASAQAHFYISDAKRMPVPLPPLAEQAEIVSEVSEALSQIESAEAAIERSLRRAARLRQSILKQAFAGKLVTQDPTDEPASQLLARLQADSAAKLSELNSAPRTRSPRKRATRSPSEPQT